MIHQELYNTICQAKIKESLFVVSKILLEDFDKNIDIIQDTFIAVCSYIGSYITLIEIKLWLDTVNDVIQFIEDEQVAIKNVFVLITKLCLLCDIYIKFPVTKTGTIGIKMVRDKIIDMFENDSFKLSMSGINRFEGIIPPTDSPSYTLATQIITGYVYILKQVDELSGNDLNKLSDIANKIRNSFDYIIRKRYTFDTKFYESDNDSVWFIWGLISLLYQDTEMNNIYQLFNFGYSKKIKNNRIGLLWAGAIVMVYIKKKNVARMWTQNEIKVIKKIEELSLVLYNDIKKELIKNNEIEEEVVIKTCAVDGLDYITSLRPKVSEKGEVKKENKNIDNEVKSIKCKKDYMKMI